MCRLTERGIRERFKEGEAMEYNVKEFNELTTRELYEILKLRSDVCVVEQNCVYPDIDGIDYDALHFYLKVENRIEAYLRVFPIKEGVFQIGRVVTREHGKGYGGKLMEFSLPLMEEKLQPKEIVMEAQVYATGFYEKYGFEICSEEFPEDGIPHVKMKRVYKRD